MTAELLTFGPFTLDPATGSLRGPEGPIPLSHRAIALLQTLLEAQGQPVAKSTLLEAAWPGQIVEDGNLTVQISALRKALGTGPDGQEWIVTVPRVGYRLLRQETAPNPEPATPPVLAVLPFANLSGDPEQDYFADGVAEDIITALSRFKSFAVISRNSSFLYKGRSVDVRQVGHDLGVRYVLEGSIRRAGDRLRIATHLADATSGAQLWAENFDGVLEDVFDFQDLITARVATVIEPQIEAAELQRSRRDRPGSIAVYDIYLRALPRYWAETEDDTAQGLALLTEALALEPDNAPVLALAATALMRLYVSSSKPATPQQRLRCAELARRGLQHAKGDATVMARCGLTLIHVAKDYELGMSAVRSAVETNPNNLNVVITAGVASLHCATMADAFHYLHRAIKLNPRDVTAYWPLTAIAHAHMIVGDYREALVFAERSMALWPDFACNLWMLIAANAHLGRMDEAQRFLADLVRVNPGITVSRIWAGQPQMDSNRCAAILQGLRLAGLPES